jgi:hypothetical protein
MTTAELIRDLARLHGHEYVADDVLEQVEHKLACAFIDQWLDKREQPPAPKPENDHDGKA